MNSVPFVIFIFYGTNDPDVIIMVVLHYAIVSWNCLAQKIAGDEFGAKFKCKMNLPYLNDSEKPTT